MPLSTNNSKSNNAMFVIVLKRRSRRLPTRPETCSRAVLMRFLTLSEPKFTSKMKSISKKRWLLSRLITQQIASTRMPQTPQMNSDWWDKLRNSTATKIWTKILCTSGLVSSTISNSALEVSSERHVKSFWDLDFCLISLLLNRFRISIWIVFMIAWTNSRFRCTPRSATILKVLPENKLLQNPKKNQTRRKEETERRWKLLKTIQQICRFHCSLQIVFIKKNKFHRRMCTLLFWSRLCSLQSETQQKKISTQWLILKLKQWHLDQMTRMRTAPNKVMLKAKVEFLLILRTSSSRWPRLKASILFGSIYTQISRPLAPLSKKHSN